MCALAVGLAIPATASAGTVETTAYQVMQGTSKHYLVPLKLSGGPSAVICDAYKMRLPISTSCLIRTGYPKSFCTIGINMASNGHATGLVACGRLKAPQWAWRAHYTWNGKAFTWHTPQRVGAVPWPS